MRILVVEDDVDMAAVVQAELLKRFAVEVVGRGTEGIAQAAKQPYDLVIVDLNLPDVDGVTVCRRIRQQGGKMPILVLTGVDLIDQKVQALDAGADDYLTKPFSFEELLARVRALLRRPTDVVFADPLVVGDLAINTVTFEVIRQGQVIPLRRKEFNLLEYLARHRGQVVTRRMILEHVWNDDTDPLSNTVDVHINYLREKIDKPFHYRLIKTVPGMGYKLEVPG